MSRVVYKFKCDSSMTFVVPFAYVKPLFIEAQNGDLCLWAEVEPEYKDSGAVYEIMGTGHPIPPGAIYVASCIVGSFVWHLYQVNPPSGGEPRR